MNMKETDNTISLECELTDLLHKYGLSNSLKEKVMGVIKNEPPSFKLYPVPSNENNLHQKYQTKDGKYSLIIAFDSFYRGKFYFYTGNNSNIKLSYNSLNDNKMFENEESCIKEAELWLSKVIGFQ